MQTALIILAAGQGTRMNSDMPKMLHKVAGAALITHALAAGSAVKPAKTVLVVGRGADDVAQNARAHDPDVIVVEQAKQLGTGHATNQARAALADFSGDVLVLYGDTPFIRAETLARMAQARADHDLVVLGFEADDPGTYGRLILDGDRLTQIVEAGDCSPEQRAITVCNSGVILTSAPLLFDLLDAVGTNNASGEFYLTDIVELANQRDLATTAVICDQTETLGVNSRADLAAAEAVFQSRARATALDLGVTMTAPDTVTFAHDTQVGRDVIIEPHVVFAPGVTIETGAQIRAFSHLEACHVGARAVVGPYARLRPGTELGNDARIGNFVEIKNAQVGEGAKINHLSYVGDATVGARANIGAGTVTCNYDGVNKHHTDIGENAFIGSNTMLIAPVKVGMGAMTASGSVISSDVPDGALAVARVPQVTKPGLARKLFAKFKSASNKQQKD